MAQPDGGTASAESERMARVSIYKFSLLVAILVLFALFVPPPHDIALKEWRHFVLFAGTILAVLWQVFPLPLVVLLSLAVGGALGLLSQDDIFRGFSNSVVWIIVAAFVFARAFLKTGLGKRIALLLVSRFGRSSLRLGYSLAITDLVLAPMMASNTARAGGVIYPVARSLAGALGSEPGPTSRRIGSYILFTAYQSNVVTSAMFLTATAVNGLLAKLALDTAKVNISWKLWFVAASVPGLISLLTIPLLIYWAYPPEITVTPDAQEYANRELSEMGPLKREEKILAVIFIALAITWITASLHGISTEAAALLALCSLILSDTIELNDLVGNTSAWSTFTWVGGMLSLAAPLTRGNLIGLMVNGIQGWLPSNSGVLALVAGGLIYFFLHYAFVSGTAHILTLYVPFLTAILVAGAPPLLASLVLCFLSLLNTAVTYYGSGPAPVFFGSGYIERNSWLRVGLLVSLVNLGIWFGVGLIWWRLIGIW